MNNNLLINIFKYAGYIIHIYLYYNYPCEIIT